MKKLLAWVLLVPLWLGAAERGFWEQLTPEERAAAGLGSLTPDQQAALDRAAARFAKEGARAAVDAAKTENKEEVRRAREEARAELREESRRKKVADAGLPTREDDETIGTRIVGPFRGWEGRTTFTLENGQVWQQTDQDSRFFPKRDNPEVRLIPSRYFGWKLELVDGGLGCRVKRIK